MPLDTQTTIFMTCLVYIVLHGVIWLSLSEYRDLQIKIWCASGLISGLGVVFLSLRGTIPEFVFHYVGQLLMVLGNWWRLEALCMYLPTKQTIRRRLHAVANVVYYVFYIAWYEWVGDEHALILVFFGFYAILCFDYFVIGWQLYKAKPQLGSKLIMAAGFILTVTLSIRTIALAWSPETQTPHIYAEGWDQYVMIMGQFIAIPLLNIGFLRIFLEYQHYKKQQTEKNLFTSQIRVGELALYNDELASLLRKREEIIHQLTQFNKTAGMGALVASLAHELNQPLTAIQMNGQFIHEVLNANPPLPGEMGVSQVASSTMQAAVSALLTDNRRAADIIKTLRNFFSGSANHIDIVDCSEILRDVIFISKPQLKNKGIQIEIQGLDAFMPTLAVRSQLQQVFLNLVSNAIESFANINPNNPTIQISIYVDEITHKLNVEVADNGCGVPINQGESIFNLFKSDKDSGMGVGLWLSRTIIESIEGRIHFINNVGGGSRFLVTMPYFKP